MNETEKPKKRYLKNPMVVRADFDDAPHTLAAFRVMGHLSRRIGKNPNAWCSVDAIINGCDLCRSTVKRAIKELIRDGWLHREIRPQETNLWSMTTPANPIKKVTRLKSSPTPRLESSPHIGQDSAPPPGIESSPQRSTGINGVQKKENNEGGEGTPAAASPSELPKHEGKSKHQSLEDFTADQLARLVEAAGSAKLAGERVGVWQARKNRFKDPRMANEEATNQLVDEIERWRRDRAPKLVLATVGGRNIKINPEETIAGEKRYRRYGKNSVTGLAEYMDDEDWLLSDDYAKMKMVPVVSSAASGSTG